MSVYIISAIESEQQDDNRVQTVWLRIRELFSRRPGFIQGHLYRSTKDQCTPRYYGMSEWASEEELRQAMMSLLTSDLPDRITVAHRLELYERVY